MPTALPGDSNAAKTSGAAADSGRKLTGVHVLLMLIAFFGLVAVVNGVMIRYATSTFSGEVAKKPYEQGLAYNKEIEAAREQEARGWKIDGKVAHLVDNKTQIEITARDAAGAPVAGLQVAATLAAPADKKLDRTTPLQETAPGVYRGALVASAGAWDLDLKAEQGGKPVFRSTNRITLK